MTVNPHPRDAAGAAKQAEITALQALVAPSGSAKVAYDAKLDATQKELVNHYMNIGRITAANVLSTLS